MESGNNQISKYTEDSQKQHIIVIGNTGVGKSTFVNYITGAKLINKIIKKDVTDKWVGWKKDFSSRTVIDVDPNDENYANRPKVGHGTTSETIIPNCYEDTESNRVYWDCLGFKDNRGPLQEIVNSFYIEQLFTRSKEIKIVFIVSKEQLNDTKFTEFREFITRITDVFGNSTSKLKNGVFIVTKVDDVKDGVKLYQNKMRELAEDAFIKEEEKNTLKALIKCKFEIVPSNIVSSAKDEVIVGTKDKLIDTIEATSAINDIEVKLAVSDKAYKASAQLFKNFENTASRSIGELVKLLDLQLKDKDLDKTLDFLNFANSKTTANKDFFRGFKDRLKALDIPYNDFRSLENMFKSLEFLSIINHENKVNYGLLQFQALVNTKSEILSKITESASNELEPLKRDFIQHFQNDISAYKKSKNKDEITKIQNNLEFKIPMLSESHPLKLLEKYNELKNMQTIVNRCKNNSFLKAEKIHEILEKEIEGFLSGNMNIALRNALKDLSESENIMRAKQDMKVKYRHEAIEHSYNKSHAKGELEFNCDSNNKKNIFKGAVIKLSDVEQKLKECITKHPQIKDKDVYILSYDKVNFDQSIDFSEYGNIAIAGLNWIIEKDVRLDLSGRPIPNPSPAANGNSNHKDGQHGNPGKPGNPGKHFLGVVDLDEQNNKCDLSKLTFDVRGGNGQRGQEGGDGKNGSRGYFVSVENGGDGGNGGVGGVPSKSGSVKIYQGYEIDKLLIGYNTAPNNSKEGNSGIGGSGGEYGIKYAKLWGENITGKNGSNGNVGSNIKDKKQAADHPGIKKYDIQNFYCRELAGGSLSASDKFLNGDIDLSGDINGNEE